MNVSTTSTVDPKNMYDYINNLLFNPVILIILLVIIIIGYILVFSSLGNSIGTNYTSSDSLSDNKWQKIVIFIVVAIVIMLVVVNAFKYFFSINVTAFFNDFFSNKPQVNIVVDQTTYNNPLNRSRIKLQKQVFNIPGNYYNYENAKALCTSYKSKLATYKQLDDTYRSGGEWCNYGWSEGQNAYFPTQQKTFDNLQKIKGHEHDCGRPGVNGGYIANPNIRFGVNCYGYKPNITKEEQELMKTVSPYPQTVEDLVFQKRVDFWKQKIDTILVSPFNYNSWSGLII